jgi:hypothetical protein
MRIVIVLWPLADGTGGFLPFLGFGMALGIEA